MDRGKIIIRSKNIETKVGDIEQAKLKFYPDNPRIYSVINTGEKEPSQRDIENKLVEMDHVKQLYQDIKANGGLIDPILVMEESCEVIEGNSRLAAYRLLVKEDPIKWGKIRAMLLPKGLEESLIFALLSQYHIKGKKDWAPYEQAGFIYRRIEKHNISYSKLADELGMSQREIKKLTEIYGFMLKHKEKKTARWSYYDVYLRAPKTVQDLRNVRPEIDKIIVKKIKGNEFEKALDFRKQLPYLAAAKNKTLESFISNEITLRDVYDLADASGKTSDIYKKLNKFRSWLVDKKTEKNVSKKSGQEAKKIIFELEKVAKQASKLLKKIKK